MITKQTEVIHIGNPAECFDARPVSDDEIAVEGYAEYWQSEYVDRPSGSLGVIDRTDGERVWIAARRALMEDMKPAPPAA
jgi:hypothetical protein